MTRMENKVYFILFILFYYILQHLLRAGHCYAFK